jgi:hypothetical protein
MDEAVVLETHSASGSSDEAGSAAESSSDISISVESRSGGGGSSEEGGAGGGDDPQLSPSPPKPTTGALMRAAKNLEDDDASALTCCPQSVRVLRYLVDLSVIIYACALVVGGFLALLKVTVYTGDLANFDRERVPGEQVLLFGYNNVLVGWLLNSGAISLVMWYQTDWRSSWRRLAIAGTCTMVLTIALWLVREFLLPSNIVTLLMSVVCVVGLTLFVARHLNRQQRLVHYQWKTLLSIVMIIVAVSVYYLAFATLYSFEEDWQRALVRLFLHPIVWELAYSSARMVALTQADLRPNSLMATPAIILTFSSLYGRFFVSSMGSSATTMLVSAILGFEEVAMRLSIRWRDRWIGRFLTFLRKRLCGLDGLSGCACSARLTAAMQLPSEADQAYQRRRLVLYSDLAGIDIVAEDVSIIIAGLMLGLFGGMPWERVLLDAVLQLLVEFLVDWCCVMLETRHKLRVVENWEDLKKPRPDRRSFMTPIRRWALFVTCVAFIVSLFVTQQLYEPGYGLLVKNHEPPERSM